MDKRERELRRMLKKHGYQVTGYSGSCHRWIENPKTGHRFTTSVSPKNFENTLREIQRAIKKYGGKGSSSR